MERKFRLGTVMAFAAAAAAVTFVVTFLLVQWQFNSKLEDRAALDSELSKYIEARTDIEKSFVGDYTEEELLDGAVKGMVDGLGDRWSHYLSAEDYESYQENISNKYVGIGAVIDATDTEDGFRITKVYPNSPAADAGLEAGDTITAVNGVLISDMEYDTATAAIRGEEGTTVELTITKADGSEAKAAGIVRRAVNIPVVSTELLDGNIGLITIDNFDDNSDQETEQAVNRFINSGVTGIVFDVRNNPGGQLSELLDLLDFILPEGTTFISRDKAGNEKTYTSDASCIEIPMAVLVNASSYSAAEFFAAALQEYGWATVVGEQTFGKGYSQIPIRLSDGSAIILSTNEYFTPHGVSLIGTGLTPDYPVEMSEEDQAKLLAGTLSRDEDAQLQKALEVVKAEASQAVTIS